MRALLAIPDHPWAAEVLQQQVAGVPLLIRVIATAVRAGADSVLIIWPTGVEAEISGEWRISHELKNVTFEELVWTRAFDPRDSAQWASIAGQLSDEFLWLPWNWVTYKRALAGLTPSHVRPVRWSFPVILSKRAVLENTRLRIESDSQASGVSITSQASVSEAERLVIANSGKALDGIYSNFNRRLCRPAVRALVRTPVTPNQITLAGLVAAILAAVLFSRGSYGYFVAGALLFFLSGLFDEMDGMIARTKFLESAFGTWFEGFVDNATYLLVFSGMTIGLARQYGSWAWRYGAALVVGSILSIVVIAFQRKLATAPDRPHEYAGTMNTLLESDKSNPISWVTRQVSLFVKKAVLIHYVLLFSLLGGLPVFLWLGAVGSNVTWIVGLYFSRRFFRRSYPGARNALMKTAA